MPSDIDDSWDVARITIQAYRGALIASIQVDLEERVLHQFQSDLLESVVASAAKVAIIDLSGVDVMDAQDFEGLRRIINMASLMGTETALCGIQPGVAAALVNLDVTLDDLKTHLDLDAALAHYAASAAQEATSLDEDDGVETLENREANHGNQGDEALDQE